MASISNFVRDMEDSLEVERIAEQLWNNHSIWENWKKVDIKTQTRYRKAAAAAWVILNDKDDDA